MTTPTGQAEAVAVYINSKNPSTTQQGSATIIDVVNVPNGAPASFRWDNVFTGFIVSIFVTVLQFAGSHDYSFNKRTMTAIFIHFAFEMNLSWYFAHSGKAAMYLGRVCMAIYFIQALLSWVIFETMLEIFQMEFVISDTFVFLSSICLMFNKAMPRKIRLMAFSVTLHSIGGSLAMYYLPINLYLDNTNPMSGAPWVLIALASVLQLWLCQDVVRGGINDIGPVVYDENKNSRFFILFSKYGVLFLSFLVAPSVAFVLFLFRTTESTPGLKFAGWIWPDVTTVLGWPIGMFGILLTLYLRATPHQLSSDKKL